MTAKPLRSRERLGDVIVRRPRVGTVTGLLLALAFALVVTPIVLAESWALDPRVAPGAVAPVTVRVGADDVGAVSGGRRTGGVIIARGERATPAQAEAVANIDAGAPRGLAGFGAYGLVLFALAAGFTHHLKRSTRGRLLRIQLVLLGTIALGALVTKGLLLAYPLSVLAVPVALGAIVPTLVHDRTVGLATGVLAAVVMSLLVRFDVGVVTVLVMQAVAAAIVIPERPRPRWSLALAAGAVALAGAALTYMAFAYLSSRALPFEELANPAASSFVAAGVGGVMAGLLAMPVLPLYERACGEITHRSLVALEDLSHPLLRQIAEKAPGTWQHSLAMANLAEVAAHAIGASGRLVRVGAYFHDLGKSVQPTFFIENLATGEPSPHDQLAPEVSCDAIFSHVTEGILLARRHKLPERIIDFMHMHHGDGVLEYFWAKCQETGNPRALTIADFRYPGVPPQSRETAILAVCDAVEAASRTLKRPDARSVETLVQRIVYGKLHLGQLDESGLSMSDLRRMSDSLREAIRHAHHDRIEYPWQREAAAEAAAAAASTGAGASGSGSASVVTVAEGRPRERVGLATQRLMSEPRLDSLDVPRPMLWDDRGREAGLSAASVPVPPVAEATPPAASGPVRKPRELAAFGDTIDLAIATTAGLGLDPPAPASASALAATPAASAGPTADAFVDAVVNAEASADGAARGKPILPPPPSGRLPALRLTAPALAAVAPPAELVDDEEDGDDEDARAEHIARVVTAEIRRPAPIPAPGAPEQLDEEAHRRAVRPTEPVVVPTAEVRARGAVVRAPTAPTTLAEPTTPVPAFHRSDSATFHIPEPTPKIPAPIGSEAADEDEPEIEIGVSPPGPEDDVVEGDDVAEAVANGPMPRPVTRSAPPPAPPTSGSTPGGSWLGSLSARIDAMLDADDEAEVTNPELGGLANTAQPADDDNFGGETVRRLPPSPPPGRSRPIPRLTQQVGSDDVEAVLELSPTVRTPGSGVFVGPPPMTRAGRSQAAVPVPPVGPAGRGEDGPDAEEGPTVVGPQPSGSMLPPRARRGPDHG